MFACQIFYAKSGGEEKNLKSSPLLTQKTQNFLLFKPQGGGSSENLSFHPIGGG